MNSSNEESQKLSLYGFATRDDLRRVNPSERKTYEAKQMWQRHHEIVNLSALGYKNVEIAQIVHCDPQTVSNVLNSTMPKEKLAELREIRDGETKKRLEQVRILTDKAIDVYHDIFDNDNGEVGLKEKKEVADTVLLELSGLRVPTKVAATSVGVVLTADELREFKERGIAAAREAGLVIDIKEEKAS